MSARVYMICAMSTALAGCIEETVLLDVLPLDEGGGATVCDDGAREPDDDLRSHATPLQGTSCHEAVPTETGTLGPDDVSWFRYRYDRPGVCEPKGNTFVAVASDAPVEVTVLVVCSDPRAPGTRRCYGSYVAFIDDEPGVDGAMGCTTSGKTPLMVEFDCRGPAAKQAPHDLGRQTEDAATVFVQIRNRAESCAHYTLDRL